MAGRNGRPGFLAKDPRVLHQRRFAQLCACRLLCSPPSGTVCTLLIRTLEPLSAGRSVVLLGDHELGISCGCLGPGREGEHAPAAFLASLEATEDLWSLSPRHSPAPFELRRVSCCGSSVRLGCSCVLLGVWWCGITFWGYSLSLVLVLAFPFLRVGCPFFEGATLVVDDTG